MKIAILGTGTVGSALGEGFASAGHEVVYGSRDPQADSALAGTITTLNDAARTGDVVVNALPGAVALSVLGGLDAAALEGKVLLDVANALTDRFELLYPNGSLAAQLQDALPNVRVVKTLNTISAQLMANPGALPSPATVFLSGNDGDAKNVASGLLTDLGWAKDNQLDLGDISTARGTEHYLLLFLGILQSVGSGQFGIAVVH